MASKKPRPRDDDGSPDWAREGSPSEPSRAPIQKCAWTTRGFSCLAPPESGTGDKQYCGWHSATLAKAAEDSRAGLEGWIGHLKTFPKRADGTPVGYCCGWTHHTVDWLWQFVSGEQSAKEELLVCNVGSCPQRFCADGTCDHAEHAGRMRGAMRPRTYMPTPRLVHETADGMPAVLAPEGSRP